MMSADLQSPRAPRPRGAPAATCHLHTEPPPWPAPPAQGSTCTLVLGVPRSWRGVTQTAPLIPSPHHSCPVWPWCNHPPSLILHFLVQNGLRTPVESGWLGLCPWTSLGTWARAELQRYGAHGSSHHTHHLFHGSRNRDSPASRPRRGRTEGQKGRGGACLSARLWPKVSHHIPVRAGAAFSQTGDQRRGEAGLGQEDTGQLRRAGPVAGGCVGSAQRNLGPPLGPTDPSSWVTRS